MTSSNSTRRAMAERQNQSALPEDDAFRYFQGGIKPDTIPAIVVLLFILLANSCVLLLIGCYTQLRTTTNLIFASLAVSDFLMGLVGIPLVVTCSATFLNRVCLSSVVLTTFLSTSTAVHVTIITCDRYIYILYALRYRDIITRSRVVVVLCLTWCACLAVSLVRLSWTLHVRIENAKEDLIVVIMKEMIYFSFNFVAFFFVPFVLMIILDVRMILVVWRQSQRIKRENLPVAFANCERDRKLRRRQKKAVFTCILLLALYVVFWLPYFVLEFAHHATADPLGVSNAVNIAVYYLRFCTSLINPFIYTLRKHDLKKAVKSIIKKASRFRRERKASDIVTEHIPLSSRRNTANVLLLNGTETSYHAKD